MEIKIHNRKKQILYTLAGVGSLIVLLGLIKYLQIAKAISDAQKFSPPPETVTSIIAEEQVWPATFKSVGSIQPTQGAILSAESGGEVAKINFESGDFVEAGKVLVELDTSVEEANLKGAQASLEQARKSYERAKFLKSKNSISQAELETAEAEMRNASASVESLNATITRKRVVTPFSGRAGIRKVNVGDYVSQGMPIVPVFSLNPLYVNFNLPENAVPQISNGLAVEISVSAFPDQIFEGKVTSFNPQVDQKTRNIEIQATINNQDEKIKPGMFANVTLVLPKEEKHIVIPGSSISYAPYGNSVYVIQTAKNEDGTEKRTVRQQIIKTGPQRGNQVAITSGLKPGEEVVTSGTFKLRPDALVVVNNELAPTNDPNPNPANT